MKGMRNLPVTGIVMALVLILAACAQRSVGWHKPGASKEQWQRDRSTCRFQARKEADKRFGQLGSEVGSPAFSPIPTLAWNMAVLKSRKEERRLFESCMRMRGYSKQAKNRANPEQMDSFATTNLRLK